MAVVSESPTSEEHGADARTYVYVWIALLVLTVFELAASVMDFLGPEISAVIILIFTFAKAILVAGFFMHLFFEKRKKFLVMTVFIIPMVIVIPIVTLDVILPNYF